MKLKSNTARPQKEILSDRNKPYTHYDINPLAARRQILLNTAANLVDKRKGVKK